MILLGGALLLLAAAGLWLLLAYQSERPEEPGKWVCEGKEWVKKGETDEPKPPMPCPENTPSVKGPTAPPPGN